jgi:hypothetical protein
VRRARFVILLALVASCRKDAGREAFATGWRQAVADRDGDAAWALLDRASRERIVAGLERAQQRAAGDPAWREIFVWVNRPIDMTAPAEEVARRLLGARLGRGIDLADDGSPRIHREQGRWVAAVDPVGFTAADGTPLTLTALWLQGAADPRAPLAPSLIKVPWQGRLIDEIDAAYAAEGARLAGELGLGEAYAIDAARVMQIHASHGTGQRAGITEFEIGTDGGIAPTLYVWSGPQRGAVPDPQPRLDFRRWPVHK